MDCPFDLIEQARRESTLTVAVVVVVVVVDSMI